MTRLPACGRFVLWLLLPGLGCWEQKANAAETSQLRYQFSGRKTFVYSLRLEGSDERTGTTRLLQGLLFYEVLDRDMKSGQIHLNTWASLRENVAGQENWGPPRFVFPGPGQVMKSAAWSVPRRLTINFRGELVEEKVRGFPGPMMLQRERPPQLPYLLGEVWQVCIEPLPDRVSRRWQRASDVQVVLKDSGIPFPPFVSTESYPAKETVSYRQVKGDGQKVVLEKTFRLVTEKRTGERPLFEQDLKGQIIFDTTRGIIEQVDFSGTLRAGEKGEVFHVKLDAKVLTDEEADAELARRAKAVAQTPSQAQTLAKPENVDEILAKIRQAIDAGGTPQAAGLVMQLAQIEPVAEKRKNVIDLLMPLLDHRDGFLVRSSIQAVTTWGEPEDIAKLGRFVNDRDVFIRQAAVQALAKAPTEETAAIVAETLTDMQVRSVAVATLKQMGPVAETAVLGKLKHPDWAVRLAAIEVLEAVRTEKSLPDIQDLLKEERNPLVRRRAEGLLQRLFQEQNNAPVDHPKS